MSEYPKAISDLIEELRKLPGVGPKSAQRLSFYLASSGKTAINKLIDALEKTRDKIGYCSLCGTLTDQDPCPICTDPKRNQNVICVVGYPKDVLALERSGQYRGVYHVLHGYIQPLKGIGPDNIRVKELLARVLDQRGGKVEEVILATNPDVDGETTALYLAKLLKAHGVKVTRLARGLPFGAELDYADEVTLAKSLEGRREV